MRMMQSYTSRSDQYNHEYNTWSRMLEFYNMESAFLKTRLSEAVDHGIDKESLALAEHFQNQFIIKDDFIIELKQDITWMEKAISNNEDSWVVKLDTKQNKLRNEINYLEKSFNELKNEFNKFLLSIS